MNDSPLSYFLKNCDINYYRKLYIKTANYRGSNKISFHDFYEIICHSNKNYDNSVIQSGLEKIRMSTNHLSVPDSEILIDVDTFFGYLNIIEQENFKKDNENDNQFRSLYNLLCEDKDTIPKSKLTHIIKTFDLPIIIDEFFSFLGKKEELSFLDFCCLLQSNKHQEDDKDETISNEKLFPIEVKKKCKLIGFFDNKEVYKS